MRIDRESNTPFARDVDRAEKPSTAARSVWGLRLTIGALGSVVSTAESFGRGFMTKDSLMVPSFQLSQPHAEWLEEKRKIPCETAAEMGIVSSGQNLVFEFHQNGNCRFRKFRTPDKRFWIEPRGSQLQFWNESELCNPSFPDAPRIITEGELDAASFKVAGATHVGSVPNGAAGKPGEGDIVPSEDKQFAYLWDGPRIKSGLATAKKIILATDADPPGQILFNELAIRLGRNRCWYVTYPEGCKDANDVLVKHGPDAVSDLIADAKPLVPNRLVKFSDIPNRADAPRFSSGWSGLDKHLMIVPPELMVVTGPPGAGKSQWTMALCCNLARIHGLKGAILQFEDNPERNRRDLLRYARSWTNQTSGGITEAPEAWVDRMFRTIAPSESFDADTDFNLAWIHEAIDEAAGRHGARWVLIDPWNEVEHIWKVNETETTYTNQALRDLKKLTRRHQIALIIVTHPTKGGAIAKTIEEFSLYDCSGSAAWKNKADHGIIVHRNDASSMETHIKIDKSKDFQTMGRPGIVRMAFAPERATFNFVS